MRSRSRPAGDGYDSEKATGTADEVTSRLVWRLAVCVLCGTEIGGVTADLPGDPAACSSDYV